MANSRGKGQGYAIVDCSYLTSGDRCGRRYYFHQIGHRTALRVCVEHGQVETVNLLLHNGADQRRDRGGWTPLLCAAAYGRKEMVEILIGRPEYSRHERVDALELLGATLVDGGPGRGRDPDLPGGMVIWEAAMAERYRDADAVLHKPARVDGPVLAYNNALEVQSLDELRRLDGDRDGIWMQALLIEERVLGPVQTTATHIRKRGQNYLYLGDFGMFSTLSLRASDMMQHHLEPLNSITWRELNSIIQHLFETLGKKRQRNDICTSSVLFSCLMDVFDRAVIELKRGMGEIVGNGETETMEVNETNKLIFFERIMVIVLQLVSLACRMSNGLSSEEIRRVENVLCHVVELKPRGLGGYTLLHLTCSRRASLFGEHSNLLSEFPDPAVVTMLIKAGAAVNAVDDKKNTPLHIIAMSRSSEEKLNIYSSFHSRHLLLTVSNEYRVDILKILRHNGAHLDASNMERRTAMQLLQDDEEFEDGYIDISPDRYLSLQCLAAKAIVKYGIPYQDLVPEQIRVFISMH